MLKIASSALLRMNRSPSSLNVNHLVARQQNWISTNTSGIFKAKHVQWVSWAHIFQIRTFITETGIGHRTRYPVIRSRLSTKPYGGSVWRSKQILWELTHISVEREWSYIKWVKTFQRSKVFWRNSDLFSGAVDKRVQNLCQGNAVS